MRLIIIGAEYAGKTTLAGGIEKWLVEKTGTCDTSFHDHFMPFASGLNDAEWSEEEIAQLRALNPGLFEQHVHYLTAYHMQPAFYQGNDHGVVNWYYSEAVYAPIYFDYGGPEDTGEYGDRSICARAWDLKVLREAPNTVLVLLKASPEVIRQRMRGDAHPRSVQKEEHVELILDRFQEEYDKSLIRRRFVIDTSHSKVEETFQEFLEKMTRHLTDRDLMRIAVYQMTQRDFHDLSMDKQGG